MAKLLTAMSVVVPTNGYILYGDNNTDTLMEIMITYFMISTALTSANPHQGTTK